MDRELLMTGIGGQGVQLGAQVLARAAVADGYEVMLFGSYGGMMRGGNTDVTLVFSDAAVEAPPTIDSAWSGIVMHPAYAAAVASRIEPGGVVLLNTSVCGRELIGPEVRVVEIAATDLAATAGNAMMATMVMIGAYAAATGVASPGALDEAVARSLPSYREQHVLANRTALQAGRDAVPALLAPAWAA